MSTPKRMQSTGLALVVLCLGIGFADPSSALEIACGRSVCIGRLQVDLREMPNLRLTGTPAFQGHDPFGSGTTVLGDLVQPMASHKTHRGFHALRIRPRPDRIRPIDHVNAIPEPSAALVFGLGMLVASGLLKRTGELE